jgi:glycosyltransferase involved in cell wall biosynthesis
MWLDTQIRGYFAKRSVEWADRTVAPSQAFADDLRRWTGRDVMAVHHGFDREVFFGDHTPLPYEVAAKLPAAGDSLRLLFVSHYNYYRNFETLFRAVALLRDRMPQRKIRLFLTCTLDPTKTPGTYKTGAAASLIRKIGIREEVVELGAVPYRQLHHLYRACDIYVTSAYAETFAHPLVEAMACGLPIVASDLPVHREIAGAAAVFFPPFSAEGLAECVLQVATAEDAHSATSTVKQPDFSWAIHVQKLIGIAIRLRSAKGIQPADYTVANTRSRTAS